MVVKKAIKNKDGKKLVKKRESKKAKVEKKEKVTKRVTRKKKIKKTFNIKRIVFLTLSTLFIAFLFLILIIIMWAKTESGFQFFDRLAESKPINSWQAKIYYGLYKKYPTLKDSVNIEEDVSANDPTYSNKEISSEINLSSDKNLYHSGEKINLNLKIKSSKKIKDANLFIFGIKNRYKEYSVYEVKIVDLKEGDNEFNYSLPLPYCNSCSGVKEGEYQIKVQIIKNKTLLGEGSLSISLKQ